MNQPNPSPVFCGYASLQDDQNISRGIASIESIFNLRRKELTEDFLNNESAYLFKPFIFHVFGEYDLFTLSLVSDFNFSARYFRQYYLNKAYPNSNSLMHKYAFLSTSNLPRDVFYTTITNNLLNNPLISIIHIKLDVNIHLSKNRDYILNEFSIDLKNHLSNWDYNYLWLDSFSWNDITIIAFGNSFSKLLSTIEFINAYYYGNEVEGSRNKFTLRTESTLGYYGDISQLNFDKIDSKDTINPFVQSRLIDINSNNNKIERYSNSKYYWTTGKFDIVSIVEPTSSMEFLKEIIESENLDIRYAIHYETLLLKPFTNFLSVPNKDNLYLKTYHSYRLDPALISKYSDCLKLNILTPTPVRDGLVNLIYAIDKYLYDPMTQISFISLAECALRHIKFVIKICEKEIRYEDFKHIASHAMYGFKIGIENRLQCSYHTRRFSDSFHLFDGGIQLPIMCIEGFLSRIYNKFKIPLIPTVCVDFKEDISITETYIRINYYHIFQPEKIASIVLCEIGQFLLLSNEWQSGNLERLHRRLFQNLEFTTLLKNELLIDNNIKEDKILSIAEDFFKHVYGDIINYIIIFKEDFNLFSEWYWLNYLLYSHAYENPSNETLRGERIKPKLISSVLNKFLLRYAIVWFCIHEYRREIEWKIPKQIRKIMNLHNEVEKYNYILRKFEKITLFNDWASVACNNSKKFVEKYLNENGNLNSELENIVTINFNLLETISSEIMRNKNEDDWQYSASFSGGISPKTVESAFTLFYIRMNYYNEMWNKIVLPRISQRLV